MNEATLEAIKEAFRHKVTNNASYLKADADLIKKLSHAITELACGMDAGTVLASLIGARNAMTLIELADDIAAMDGFDDDTL